MSTQIRSDSEINRLVNEHFGLAKHWANKWAWLYGWNDSLSIAMDGLLKAAQSYREERIPFGTYASLIIKFRYAAYRKKELAPKRGEQFSHLSLNAPVHGLDKVQEVGETIPDENASCARLVALRNDDRRMVEEMIALLDETSRMVITRRYGLDGKPEQQQVEIAAEMRVSRQRVQQIEKRAVRYLWRWHNNYRRRTVAA